MEPWFERSFGPWYPRLYPHRDLSEARRAVALLLPRLPAEGRLLDLACGAGRHLRVLRDRGRDVVGLDRSWVLLREAGNDPQLAGHLVRADMRDVPFADGAFAGVLSMFTSFGYFGSADVHTLLLREIARITGRGGCFVLDYLNAGAVREHLVPESRRVVDGCEVHERRFIAAGAHGETVVKETEIRDARGRTLERFREEVVLYDRDEVLALLERSGWKAETIFGDYDGSTWRSGAPRLLVVAEKTPS